MKPTIVRNFRRADATVIGTLGQHGVATVHEAQARSGLMRPYLRPIYPAARAAGSAVTVLCAPGDNLMIHAAIEVCTPPGVGLHVSTGGGPRQVTVDGRELTDRSWISPEYETATNRIELLANASVGSIDINPIGGC